LEPKNTYVLVSAVTEIPITTTNEHITAETTESFKLPTTISTHVEVKTEIWEVNTRTSVEVVTGQPEIPTTTTTEIPAVTEIQTESSKDQLKSEELTPPVEGRNVPFYIITNSVDNSLDYNSTENSSDEILIAQERAEEDFGPGAVVVDYIGRNAKIGEEITTILPGTESPENVVSEIESSGESDTPVESNIDIIESTTAQLETQEIYKNNFDLESETPDEEKIGSVETTTAKLEPLENNLENQDEKIESPALTEDFTTTLKPIETVNRVSEDSSESVEDNSNESKESIDSNSAIETPVEKITIEIGGNEESEAILNSIEGEVVPTAVEIATEEPALEYSDKNDNQLTESPAENEVLTVNVVVTERVQVSNEYLPPVSEDLKPIPVNHNDIFTPPKDDSESSEVDSGENESGESEEDDKKRSMNYKKKIVETVEEFVPELIEIENEETSSLTIKSPEGKQIITFEEIVNSDLENSNIHDVKKKAEANTPDLANEVEILQSDNDGKALLDVETFRSFSGRQSENIEERSEPIGVIDTLEEGIKLTKEANSLIESFRDPMVQDAPILETHNEAVSSKNTRQSVEVGIDSLNAEARSDGDGTKHYASTEHHFKTFWIFTIVSLCMLVAGVIYFIQDHLRHKVGLGRRIGIMVV
jgi:hypothetical protein